MKTANRQNRVGALRRSLASRLAAAGNDTPDLDARLLIQHV
ncbi:MAG: protein-(glutamine-N5) methyltransferase, release factor-specific, partial [Euryhalocaulis sp.]|nr:protein-(glutamine-N5) methyltransferase, release factor-specific [Euryhalocaulis sp.]